MSRCGYTVYRKHPLISSPPLAMAAPAPCYCDVCPLQGSHELRGMEPVTDSDRRGECVEAIKVPVTRHSSR